MKTDLRDYSKTMGSEESSDPLDILKTIAPLLNGKGGVNGIKEASKIVGLMRNAKKLVGRCMYLSILRVTSSAEVLDKFIAEGGWKVMNKWLSEAKDSENAAVLLEILKLLHQLPVRIEHLRENNTAKIVKHCAKSSDPRLKSSASSLMGSWMAVIRGSSTTPETDIQKKKKEKKKLKPDKSLTATAKPQSKSKTAEKANPPPVMKAPSFAKFRKTGLESEQPPKKKMKGKQVTVGKRNSVDNDKECPVPEKKAKQNVENKPKKITISEGFMDALNSASNPVPLPTKKIKRKPLKQTVPNATPSTKPNQNMEYALGDANDFSATELMRKLSPKGNESPVSTEPPKPKLNKFGKPRKTVSWQIDERLVDVRYFEVDENERVNVSRLSVQQYITRIHVDNGPGPSGVNVSTQSFKDAQHREMLIERQLLKGKLVHEEGSVGGSAWKRPQLIEGLESLVAAGCNSVEKDIQTEREKTVLMEIFLSKEMVPDSPAEPDPEPYEITQPKIIPFEDENAPPEALEPEPAEQEPGNTGDDIIMKNMLSGMQQQGSDVDLTTKLKQILETASAITNNNGDSKAPAAPVTEPQQGVPMQPGPQMWVNGMDPQGNPQMMPMQPMDMNGQPMGPSMGFYGPPMMMPMQGQNFYRPNWNGPPPQNGPPMGPPGAMHGPPPHFGNQGWNNQPRFRPGGPPPRQDFRGNWRGNRWNGPRRR